MESERWSIATTTPKSKVVRPSNRRDHRADICALGYTSSRTSCSGGFSAEWLTGDSKIR